MFGYAIGPLVILAVVAWAVLTVFLAMRFRTVVATNEVHKGKGGEQRATA